MHHSDINVSSTSTPKPSAAPRPIRGIPDWPLPDLIALDDAVPGCLTRIMRAGVLRRQAIFAALTTGVLNTPEALSEAIASHRALAGLTDEPILMRVAVILLRARAREIVAATFGSCPSCFLPLLRRLGDDPLPAAAYGRLHRLVADPAAKLRVRYLLGRERLTAADLDRAEHLRVEVLKSRLAERIGGRREIDRVNGVIDVAMRACSTLSPERLAQSLADVGPKTSATDWLHSLLQRFDRLTIEPPFTGDEEAVLLQTGPTILAASRRYKNCLKELIPDVLAGRSFFYEFPAMRVIAHVRMLSDCTGYVEDVYGRANRYVTHDLKRRAYDRLQHYGLPALYDTSDQPDLKAVAELPALWTFRDLDDGDEEVEGEGEGD